MPQQVSSVVENNFSKGLVTENTGLNFPENAATDCDNVRFDLIGNVTRRNPITWELNYAIEDFGARTNQAINTYKWTNAGGDGNVQLLVVQVGDTLRFYNSSAATTAAPISTTLLASTVDVSSFVALGGTFSEGEECRFSDGNGYLFVYHPDCEPFYCTYTSGTVTGVAIEVQIRDFVGVVDGLADNNRPSTLSDAHNYNLQNQGWISGSAWFLSDTTSSVSCAVGARSFTVTAGIAGISGGQQIVAEARSAFTGTLVAWMGGTVTSYVGTTLTVNITGVAPPSVPAGPYGAPAYYWNIYPNSTGYINSWFTSQGNYPSNADQWWRFKNASNVFDPATTQPNVSLSLGPAPKGHFILPAFSQDRTIPSNISGLTPISTTARPTNGCWFQGRVWYTGINSSQAASGTALFTTWTENIYFSQVVNKVSDFGKCYQTNDPTSEELFDILPTDGGVIVIQGSGPIYRLFPIQNGLLVFAANGIWFITGSQGIGFSATDYTITKLSSIQGISSNSYVDVEGLPYFWNEEGIYSVQPQQGGGLGIDSITFATIGTFYDEIPAESKRYARGAYNPIERTIQWIYKSENGASVYDLYSFDRILNYNVPNKAFYPFSVAIGTSFNTTINCIDYLQSNLNADSPEPGFKYFISNNSAGTTFYSFGDEHPADYLDWNVVGVGGDPTNYTSYFITGYKIRGQAIRRFQPQYLQIWSNVDENDSGYKIQGIWDYSISGNSGRWTTIQNIDIEGTDLYDVVYRRHKIRGHGYSLQFKVTSQTGKGFSLLGWAVIDTINAGS